MVRLQRRSNELHKEVRFMGLAKRLWCVSITTAAMWMVSGNAPAPAAESSTATTQHFHSLEEDLHDERENNAALRAKARERIGWRDEKGRRDSVVRIKVLGLNDFHGQLSAGRLVSGRPVGGAAVLASYLKNAAASAPDGHLIIHAGDHVGATPPASSFRAFARRAFNSVSQLAGEQRLPAC
jgi:5'-nucleotidase